MNVSEDTLEVTPGKALTFLRGVGRKNAIRAALERVGYSSRHHTEGWSLLHAASGFSPGEGEGETGGGEADEALVQLDAWDERGFATAGAALKHRHPAQHAFVFDGLTASKGPDAVLGVNRFLDRLDALRSSEARKATRAADHAALAMLAERGIHPERARLRKLVEQASSYAPADDNQDDAAAEQEANLNSLRALRAWYEEWSLIAHANITRKEYLIRLGLAQRKRPARKPPEGENGPAKPK